MLSYVQFCCVLPVDIDIELVLRFSQHKVEAMSPKRPADRMPPVYMASLDTRKQYYMTTSTYEQCLKALSLVTRHVVLNTAQFLDHIHIRNLLLGQEFRPRRGGAWGVLFEPEEPQSCSPLLKIGLIAGETLEACLAERLDIVLRKNPELYQPGIGPWYFHSVSPSILSALDTAWRRSHDRESAWDLESALALIPGYREFLYDVIRPVDRLQTELREQSLLSQYERWEGFHEDYASLVEQEASFLATCFKHEREYENVGHSATLLRDFMREKLSQQMRIDRSMVSSYVEYTIPCHLKLSAGRKDHDIAYILERLVDLPYTDNIVQKYQCSPWLTSLGISQNMRYRFEKERKIAEMAVSHGGQTGCGHPLDGVEPIDLDGLSWDAIYNIRKEERFWEFVCELEKAPRDPKEFEDFVGEYGKAITSLLRQYAPGALRSDRGVVWIRPITITGASLGASIGLSIVAF